jgi:hypothetical protein
MSLIHSQPPQQLLQHGSLPHFQSISEATRGSGSCGILSPIQNYILDCGGGVSIYVVTKILRSHFLLLSYHAYHDGVRSPTVIGHCRCRPYWPSPLLMLPAITIALSVVVAVAIAISVDLCHCLWLSPLPLLSAVVLLSLLAIAVAVAVVVVIAITIQTI